MTCFLGLLVIITVITIAAAVATHIIVLTPLLLIVFELRLLNLHGQGIHLYLIKVSSLSCLFSY
jgi:hypothetical protein